MKESDKNTRRRGDALLESIYDATVKIIHEYGYANLSFRQIAQAAKTSRTVLYRRWANPFDLIWEIRQFQAFQALDGEYIDKLQDTGSLRGNLLLLVTLYQKVYTKLDPEILNAFLFEMSRKNERIEELKTNVEQKNILAMKKLLEYSKARGEKVKEVSEMTLTLPFHLIRTRHFFHSGSSFFNAEQLEKLVDEVLIPVFKG